MAAPPVRYSLCETAHARPTSPWHIRPLTDNGAKFGGGADTLALCGRTVAWDLNIKITKHHLDKNTCKTCVEHYEAKTDGQEEEDKP